MSWSNSVYFQGQIVGEYFADLLVENADLVELKAASRITNEHEAQLLNYLRATPYEVGLLLNFGPKTDFRRKVFDNGHKNDSAQNHYVGINKYKKIRVLSVDPRPIQIRIFDFHFEFL